MENKKEVIKHSSSIQISNKINLLQRRAWNILLANAYNDLDNKEVFEVRLSDLRNMLNYDKRNNEYIKDILRSLVDFKIEWNVLDKDKNQVWGITTLLAEAQIINGKCFYAYAPTLRKKLHNPTMYAKINLSLQNKFKSKHSLALYELFIDYLVEKNGYGETPFISIEDFRKLLGLEKNEYIEFKFLNNKVINKAVREINAKSDIFVNVVKRRDGRSIVAIKFCIKKNPNTNIKLDTFIISDKKQKLLPVKELIKEAIKEPEIDNTELLDLLMDEFGISRNKSINILKSKDELYIEDNLKVVRKSIQEGKVKNIPAFTIKAIEEDFRIKKTKIEIEKKEKKDALLANRKQKEEREKLGRKIYDEFINHEINPEIKVLFKYLDETEKEKFDKWKNSNIVARRYKTEEDLLKYNIYLKYFQERKKITDLDDRFIAYAKEKGYQVLKTNNIVDIWAAKKLD